MKKEIGQPSGRKRLSRAYVAGFIDADGSIVIMRSGKEKRWYVIFVTVTQKNPKILHLLSERYGGKVSIHHKKDNPKICSTWNVKAGDAYKMLQEIRPKLVLKREQALIAMRLQENIVKHKNKFTKVGLPKSIIDYRESLRQQLKKLNQPFSPAETEFKDPEMGSDSPNCENDKFTEQKPEAVC
jgi:hypothetical protein